MQSSSVIVSVMKTNLSIALTAAAEEASLRLLMQENIYLLDLEL